MSLKLIEYADICIENTSFSEKHIVFVLDTSAAKNFAFADILEKRLNRSQTEWKDLEKSPIILDLPSGGLASFIAIDTKKSTFQRHTLLRKAIMPLLNEYPEHIGICVYGDALTRKENASAAYYVVSVNVAKLPNRKKENKTPHLKSIHVYGYQSEHAYRHIEAQVAGNTLCRNLTMTPPNELNPTHYRRAIKKLAETHQWQWEEFDMPTLHQLGAGAFYAVGQGSDPQDAAIVHLTYTPKSANKTVALVGKGICFDTGGHNLKPAKYMQNMHEDMNGSAVALGILLGASQMQLPIKIDCWLAIAQNHIGPLAYKQNDIVTSLNGTTIEIVHTDAEGRMVLADTLTLASRLKPDLMIDFATLTGSMQTAIGNRMSGIISNRDELAQQAMKAGKLTGERVVVFPFAEDYDSDLDSEIADIKQCTMDSDADHILAARFLSKFIEYDTPWLHMDLSCVNRKDGLGAIQSDINGFGVGLTLELLQQV